MILEGLTLALLVYAVMKILMLGDDMSTMGERLKRIEKKFIEADKKKEELKQKKLDDYGLKTE